MTTTATPLGVGAGPAPGRRGAVIGSVPWRHLDVSLLAALACICSIGALMVYSSTRVPLRAANLGQAYYVKRQALNLALGAVLMLVTLVVDYRRWRDLAPLVYAGMCLILIAVVSPLGARSKGHQAWFPLGSFQLQPSELSKIAMILCLAAFVSWSGRAPGRSDVDADVGLGKLIGILVMAGIPMGLIMLQPDLGTDLVFLAILAAMLVVSGVRGRHLGVLAVLGVVGVVAIVHLGILQRYQVERLTSFLDPKSNVQATGYNLAESKTAIGSGGLAGKGLFQGTQTNLSYVPEQRTDFIFTAVGEQLGFVGSAFLLLMFAFVVWRCWRAAMLARDRAGTLICIGVMSLIVFQVFENVGMTMGIMPITGIPLPFVSYGGSAIMAYSVGVGLVLNVHMRRFN